MSTLLAPLSEVPDVFVDACLRDEAGRLLFLSCFGRDTSIQQLLAAFHLPLSQGGLETIHWASSSGQRFQVDVGDPARLDKLTGRLPKDNLFGNLVHAWIFDPKIRKLDLVTRSAWLIDEREALTGESFHVRLWSLYQLLSPVPLLPHWRDELLRQTSSYVTPMPLPFGALIAYRVQLADDYLDVLSGMIKRYQLPLVPDSACALAAA